MPEVGGPSWHFTTNKHDHAEFFNEVYKLVNVSKGLSTYRHLLRRAVPFTLDTQATELVTELSSDTKRIDLFRHLARLPYDVVWLGIDYKAKVRKQIALGSRVNPYDPSREPDDMGYILERLSETRWRVIGWVSTLATNDTIDRLRQYSITGEHVEMGKPIIETMPPMFILDTEGTIQGYKTLVRDPALVHAAQHMIDNMDEPCAVGWGLTVPEEDQEKYDPDGAVIPSNIVWSLHKALRYSVTMDVPPDWEAMIGRAYPRPHNRREMMAKLMTGCAVEQAGIMRFLCAALASITAAPTVLVERKKQGHFRASGQLREYKVNSVVTIHVPGKRTLAVKKMISLFQGAKRKMARHQVHGFWRTSTAEVRPGDRWIWMYSPRYREMRWHIWIKDFERGDAALGYVLREYEVKR